MRKFISKGFVVLLLSVMFLPIWSFAQPGLSVDFHNSRRDAVRELMPNRSVALYFSASEKVRSNDVLYPFHQDPDFYYLTGFTEPNALLLIFKEPFQISNDTVKEIIFVPGRSLEYETWNGIRKGTVGVQQELGFKLAMTNEAFADFDMDYAYFDHIFYHVPQSAHVDDNQNRGDVASMIRHFELRTDTLSDRKNFKKVISWMARLREVKHSEEMVLLDTAIKITCQAQRSLMQRIDTTFGEYQAEALVEFEFRSAGAEGPGFPSIVGGGRNTCTLHYISNNAQLKSGDLLVVDVGAEFRGYTADVTRTIPVNGKFSPEQKAIYDLVLEAQDAGIALCLSGKKFWDPHEAATEVIQRGLKDLGIIRKGHEARKYFMHGTSHYLGLDVHDVGTYQLLRPGNVITVEPGIYIPEGSDCDEKWWNIGVRIEDDILITDGNPVNLSDCVERRPSAIEKEMAGQ